MRTRIQILPLSHKCIERTQIKKFFFASLKSIKKGVGPELDPDLEPNTLIRGPDPHKKATDPQHCLHDKAVAGILSFIIIVFFNFRFY
jgi:hypothetical protein